MAIEPLTAIQKGEAWAWVSVGLMAAAPLGMMCWWLPRPFDLLAVPAILFVASMVSWSVACRYVTSSPEAKSLPKA